MRIQKPSDLSAGLEYNRETSAVIYLSPLVWGQIELFKQASEPVAFSFLIGGREKNTTNIIGRVSERLQVL